MMLEISYKGRKALRSGTLPCTRQNSLLNGLQYVWSKRGKPHLCLVQVTLQIQPQSSETQKNVQLQRQRLTFNPVSSQVCRRVPQEPRDASSDGSPTTDGTVGYIRIATFSKQTTEGVKAALHQLQAEGATR